MSRSKWVSVLWIDKFRLQEQSTMTCEHNFVVRDLKCNFLFMFRCCSASHTLCRYWHWPPGGSSHHQCCHLPTQSMGCLHFVAGARHWSVGQACPVIPLGGVYLCRCPRVIQPQQHGYLVGKLWNKLFCAFLDSTDYKLKNYTSVDEISSVFVAVLLKLKEI